MPAARISWGSARVRASTMSTSWIIRSSTTSTSRLRGLKTLSRWISKNSGRLARRSSSTTAGLKRSRWPTCRMRPNLVGGSRSGAPRSRDPERWASPPGRRCRLRAVRSRPLRGTRVGVATTAASTRPASSRTSVRAWAPYGAATSAARAASISTTKASAARSDSWITRQWLRPNWPAPTTARRGRDMVRSAPEWRCRRRRRLPACGLCPASGCARPPLPAQWSRFRASPGWCSARPPGRRTADAPGGAPP